jgi:hypothetical protein
MKLNNSKKKLYIFFSVIVSIAIATLLWEKINLSINNITGATGSLILQGYNPANDTVRYIFFISLPLIVYLILNQILNKKTIRVKNLIFEENKEIINYYPNLIKISVVFITFIFLEFFSINFNFSSFYFDQMHDGTRLVPAQNYLSTGSFWKSTFMVHGFSDVFYPLLMWKIFGVESIGATRTFTIFLVLIIKILSVFLAYQFTKITKLNENSKILFFTIFSAILLSMSNYTFLGISYYISYKDIYIILFLIFFIELFIESKLKYISIFLICVTASIGFLFQIDNGIYIIFILFFYFFYLLFRKEYKDIFIFFLFFGICWLAIINLIGFDEFKAFIENTKTIILSIDIMHGMKYPEPFFSLGINSDGARGTRGLLLQLTAGLFVLNLIISNENKIFISKKVFFIFLFLLSFVMYTKALGRSDAAHIRGSHDLPILINIFFILNYFLIYCEKILLQKKILNKKVFLSLSILFLIFYYSYNSNHYNINNIKNYKKDFTTFINLKDEVFLHESEIKLVNYYKKFVKDVDCISNITIQLDAISYLLKLPTCNKYWSAWLASATEHKKIILMKLKKTLRYISFMNLEIEKMVL